MPRGSAIVKRLGPSGSAEDLLTGQVAFGNYGEMLRIMKTYKLNFDSPVSSITMSSYPGCISSTDDYAITDKGSVLMSTNLWMPRTGEFALPARTNDGLPSFLRATVATRLALNPRMWAKIYGSLMGIAGGKQWLIADYSKFKVKQGVASGTVFLVEALPRLLRVGDVSDKVHKNGFFEAHGEPHFRQIREIFGLPAKGLGSYKEHLGSALLDKASSMESLKMTRAMLSELSPARTPGKSGIVQIPITTRNDEASSTRPIPEGGMDAKLTSRCLVKKLSMQAISGPPHKGKIAPFDWSGGLGSWPHFSLPQKWNFGWVNAGADGISSPVDDHRASCS